MGNLGRVALALIIAMNGCSAPVQTTPHQREEDSSFRIGQLMTKMRDTTGYCLHHKYTIRGGVLSFGGAETYHMPNDGGIEMTFTNDRPDEVRLKGFGAEGVSLWETVYRKQIDVVHRGVDK